MSASRWAKQISDLYQHNRQSLQKFLLRRISDKDLVQDMAQESYLRLLRIDNSKLIDNPQAYLFTIARNLLNEHYTKKRFDGGSLDDEASYLKDSEESLQLAPEHESETLHVHLLKAISVLPRIQQQVLLMHRRDGMTYDEIASHIGTTKGMVKKHLSKAIIQCQDYLRKYGYEY